MDKLQGQQIGLSANEPSTGIDERIKLQELAKLEAEVAQLVVDRQLKVAQRDKLQAELTQLSGVSLETGGKIAITLLGILAAAFALWAGVPQSKLELATTQEQLYNKKKDLDAKVELVTKKSEEAARIMSELKETEARRSQVASELKDAEMRRSQAANEVAELQIKAHQLGEIVRKLQSAAGTAAPQATKTLIAETQPRVFVQFAGEINRLKVIDPLRQAIAAKGFVVPAAERINRGQTNEVRYFSDTDDARQMAQKVVDATNELLTRLGCPVPNLKMRFLLLPEGKKSPTELWLSHNCPVV